ncbi:MAG: molybdate ABC transporter substrate-binding protein [Aggregatilineales bacterium]
MAQERRTLTIFAASSLIETFEALADAFEQQNPDVEILFNFAGSSTLATQIIQGAPADIFASANPAQIQRVADAGYLITSPETFIQNRLAVIVPVDNPADIQTLDDLAHPGVRLILATPDVPIRSYTDDLLAQLEQSVVAGMLANRVSEEANVRQVVARIVLGEADAAFVYRSDVTPDIADAVQVIDIPAVINPRADYQIAITTDSNNPEVSAQFIDFVQSDTGQTILVEWGFTAPEQQSETPSILTVFLTLLALILAIL